MEGSALELYAVEVVVHAFSSTNDTGSPPYDKCLSWGEKYVVAVAAPAISGCSDRIP